MSNEIGPTAQSLESLFVPGFLLAPNGLTNQNPGLFSHEPMRDPGHGQEPGVHGAQKPGPSLIQSMKDQIQYSGGSSLFRQ